MQRCTVKHNIVLFIRTVDQINVARSTIFSSEATTYVEVFGGFVSYSVLSATHGAIFFIVRAGTTTYVEVFGGFVS
jgi:hypothetical protein